MERGQTLKAKIGVGDSVVSAIPSRIKRPGKNMKM